MPQMVRSRCRWPRESLIPRSRQGGAGCIIADVSDMESDENQIAETGDEIRAFWRAARPIMAAQQAAATALAPTLIGHTVRAAQALVDEAADDLGGHLSIRFTTGRSSTEYCYGRITARVSDGVVVAAEAG